MALHTIYRNKRTNKFTAARISDCKEYIDAEYQKTIGKTVAEKCIDAANPEEAVDKYLFPFGRK